MSADNPIKDFCPLCKGTGLFVFPKKLQVDSFEIKKRIAIELHKKGYSYRQIQKGLNYKSVRSIHRIIQDNLNPHGNT